MPFGGQPYQSFDASDESELAFTAGGETVQTTAASTAWARRPTDPTDGVGVGWNYALNDHSGGLGGGLYDNYLIYSGSRHSLTA